MTAEHEVRREPGGKVPKSFGRTVLAVAWGLLGIRKGSEFERDMANITPLHVILVGLVAVFLLVLTLILVVRWVV